MYTNNQLLQNTVKVYTIQILTSDHKSAHTVCLSLATGANDLLCLVVLISCCTILPFDLLLLPLCIYQHGCVVTFQATFTKRVWSQCSDVFGHSKIQSKKKKKIQVKTKISKGLYVYM